MGCAQVEQVEGGVVAQDDAARPVEDEQALADGVQDRLVVLEHLAQLAGRDAAGLPQQPGGDEKAGHPGGEHDARDGAERDQPLLQATGDHPDRDADRDQRHHPVPVVEHGGTVRTDGPSVPV